MVLPVGERSAKELEFTLGQEMVVLHRALGLMGGQEVILNVIRRENRECQPNT